ncbi:MAG: hypothetical protein H6R04_723 [Burkholderiaceae bacterium]|nr:hypothetical protein [Burkholderiaceae bacterium]
MQTNVHPLKNHTAPPNHFGVVFSEPLIARLAALNVAMRGLRALGYAAAYQDLNAGGARPVIKLRLGAGQSIAALLDGGGQIQAPRKVLFKDVHVILDDEQAQHKSQTVEGEAEHG